MTSFEEMPEQDKKRLLQDEETLRTMGGMYCSAHHDGAKNEYGLCSDCQACVDYSIARTRECPFKHKSNCDDCSIRCYQPEMRANIRAIMAYAGPRMLLHHPIMTFRYGRRKLQK